MSQEEQNAKEKQIADLQTWVECSPCNLKLFLTCSLSPFRALKNAQANAASSGLGGLPKLNAPNPMAAAEVRIKKFCFGIFDTDFFFICFPLNRMPPKKRLVFSRVSSKTIVSDSLTSNVHNELSQGDRERKKIKFHCKIPPLLVLSFSILILIKCTSTCYSDEMKKSSKQLYFKSNFSKVITFLNNVTHLFNLIKISERKICFNPPLVYPKKTKRKLKKNF